MIILGIIVLVVGYLVNLSIVVTVGVILVVVGAVLLLLGALNRPIAGRRYWW